MPPPWLLLPLMSLSSWAMATTQSESCPQKVPRPNIIMIVADDLGWDDVSFHGSGQIPTPNIDRLANSGVILNNYYVQPVCTPSRASFLTGKYPVRLGLQHGTIFGNQPYGLPLDVPILPQFLKPLGYKSHIVGKWHLGFYQKEFTPTFRGFDSHFGYWNGQEDYWDHTAHEDYWGYDLRRNMQVAWNYTGKYSTFLFTEQAEKIIKEHNKNEPLFLYFCHQAVHSANENYPLQAPRRLIDKFSFIKHKKRRVFAGMVAAMDESVGRIHDLLKREGMLNNSVIIFTTDNGGPAHGQNRNFAVNYPFRGGKNTYWEGGVRGVAFVHSPLIKKAGRVSYALMDATDWFPTFYHLAGGHLDKVGDLNGFNMWDTISEDTPSPRREVLHGIDTWSWKAALTVDDYKLVMREDNRAYSGWYPRHDNNGTLPTVRTLAGAVITCEQRPKTKKKQCDSRAYPCLFNIAKDPCEYNDIAKENPSILRYLLERLSQYRSGMRTVLNPPRQSVANPAFFRGVWSPWLTLRDRSGVRSALRAVPGQKTFGCVPKENQVRHSPSLAHPAIDTSVMEKMSSSLLLRHFIG